MRKVIVVGAAICGLLMLTPPAVAQDHGGGGGGGGGCGDVFGDLVHILRDPVTGQPILQKRIIEYPQDVIDWGYCPIPVDANGSEIPFVDLSCDPADVDAVVEVDYFGRLSGGRTKERNNRMHLDYVIAAIKEAGQVKRDESGRLTLGYDCETNPNGKVTDCDEWSVIDSPMESMGLYVRLMKYGHLQTDPLEEDQWSHGDPSLPTQYHPALGPEDWVKFSNELLHLLPGGGDASCFIDGTFIAACAEPEFLTSRDFVSSGSFLAGAADKNGKITADLVHYLNRILKITLNTETTKATSLTLPALIRLEDGVTIVEAPAGLPAPANERFVDFTAIEYEAAEIREGTVAVVKPAADPQVWVEDHALPLKGWLDSVNGAPPTKEVESLPGFIYATSDALRVIQFMHNYAIPAALYGFPGIQD